MPKVVSEDEKRVKLNCLVSPETMEWLRGFQGSQGAGVDFAVGVARGSNRLVPGESRDVTPKEWKSDPPPEPVKGTITVDKDSRGRTSATVNLVSNSGMLTARGMRLPAWKGPILKPSEKKK